MSKKFTINIARRNADTLAQMNQEPMSVIRHPDNSLEIVDSFSFDHGCYPKGDYDAPDVEVYRTR